MDMAWFGVAGGGYTLLLGGAVVKPLPSSLCFDDQCGNSG